MCVMFSHSFMPLPDVILYLHSMDRGWETAWETWKAYPQLTITLMKIMFNPSTLDDKDIEAMERFVIILYDRTSEEQDINKARMALFCHKGQTIKLYSTIESSLDSAHQEMYITEYNMLGSDFVLAHQELPCPSQWGCSQDTTWLPKWTGASNSCTELLRCTCKNCGQKCNRI